MNELSLFTGAGGVLGGLLLGWKSIGYVEYDDYCQRVLEQRIKDGQLHNAPIFGDIRTFISDGYAASYTGMVDIISAGFPCQPFSSAGKRAGADDSRNMWPATIECIRIVRPRYAFLENVPGLLSSGYFGTILSDLSESGYDARWRMLSAAELGAPHRRDRIWIVADATSQQDRGVFKRPLRADAGTGGQDVADADSRRFQTSDTQEREIPVLDKGGANVSAANGTGHRKQWGIITSAEENTPTKFCSWWEVEPGMGRMVDWMAYRVDRLRAIGNGQVPAVAAAAWRLLNDEYLGC